MSMIESNQSLETEKNEEIEVGGVAKDLLKQYVEKIERLEEEKRTVLMDIKDVYDEAKSRGFDTKVMRKIVSLRRMDPNDRDEQETILEVYKRALNMD